MAEKICPDCAEKVKAEARVCRFCGYRFDLAEEQQRRAEEEASLTGWQRFTRAVEDSGRERTPRVRTKTPASCCGCSCGSSGVIFVIALAAVTIISSGLGVAGSVIVGIAAAVLASRLLNAVVQRPLIARALRLPRPAVEERLAGRRP